jgi:hypothetical protein
MGILDDAIRDHLDLKRKHGARDAEVRSMEADAFGSGDRPDPFAPGDLAGEGTATAEEPASEEAVPGPDTPPPAGLFDQGSAEDPTMLVEPESPAIDPDAPPLEPPSPPAELTTPEDEPPVGTRPVDEPSETEPPTAPPEAGPPTPPPAPPEPAEPEGVPPEPGPPEADSLEDLMADEEHPTPPPEAAPPEPETGEGPSEPSGGPLEASEEPVDTGVPDPPPPPPERGTEPPGRARGRVHVPTQEHRADDLIEEPPSADDESDYGAELEEGALGEISDAPLQPEGAEAPAAPEAPAPPDAPAEGEESPELFDFETEEGSLADRAEPAAPADDFEALGPAEEVEEELDYEEEPPADETAIREPPPDDQHDTAVREPDSDEEQDILSKPPEFTEEGTEGEDLWFEKGPPQDFDFEDEQK